MSRYDDLHDPQPQPTLVDNQSKYRWYQIWWLALSQPNEQTFQAILDDPLARPQRGYLWIFLTGGIWGTAVLAFDPVNKVGILPAVLLGWLLGGTFSLIFFIMSGWLVQRIAIMLGGKGHYRHLHYLRASFTAPLNLLNIAIIPLSGMQGLGVTVILVAFQAFQLYLLGTALRVVNQFGWRESILVLSILFILSMLLSTVLLSSGFVPT